MSSVAEAPSQTAARAFVIERQGDLAILWFDLPGEKVNKFSSAVLREFSALMDQFASATDVKKIIIASRKPGIYIAGADVSEFTTVSGAEQAKEYVRLGQETFTKLAKLPQTTGAPGFTSCANARPASASASVCAAVPATVTGDIAPARMNGVMSVAWLACA